MKRIFIFLILTLFSFPTMGQEDMQNPHDALESFLKSVEGQRFHEAAEYFPSRYSRIRRVEYAQILHRLIDRYGWLTSSAGSKDPSSQTVGYIRVGSMTEPIILRKDLSPKGVHAWYFDQDFVAKILLLQEQVSTKAFDRYFPSWTKDQTYLGLAIWQWISWLLVFVVSFLGGYIFSQTLGLGFRFFKSSFINSIWKTLFPSFCLLIGLAFHHFLIQLLEFPLSLRYGVSFVENILLTLLVASLALRSLSLFADHLRMHMGSSHKRGKTALLLPMEKIFHVIIMVIAFSFILTLLGVNVTAVVAGLGVGGIAIALAGQKSVENLFGGISVILDHPVRVGDLCKFNGIEGVVEDIGLRSTKIRTFDRTMISVPNGEFSQMQLENFDERDKMRYHQLLYLRYDASLAQVQGVLWSVREILQKSLQVEPGTHRVRLISLGPHALEVELVAYILTRDYLLFLEMKEVLALEILRVLENSGCRAPYPLGWAGAPPPSRGPG